MIGPTLRDAMGVRSFLISVVLSVVLAYVAYVVSNDSRHHSSPHYASNNRKRYGLGAGDAGGELVSALRRGGDGRAAVAIIRVVGGGGNDDNNNDRNDEVDDESVRYLVQVKSHDYPIEAFRGTVCLLGGNAIESDASPLDTLRRELGEELYNPEWVDDIDESDVVDDSSSTTTTTTTTTGGDAGRGRGDNSTTHAPSVPGSIRYLGATTHFQSSDLMGTANSYAFLCALYEVTIGSDQLPPEVLYPRGANVREGRIVLLSEDQLVMHSRYAWGYDRTMEAYFGRNVENKISGAAVSDVDAGTWKDVVWTPGKK